jgi:hypothetical protein
MQPDIFTPGTCLIVFLLCLTTNAPLTVKRIHIRLHAENRLERYGVDGGLVIDAINNPDEVVRGKRKGEIERWIAHKLLDDEYMLRVIYEVENEDIKVITLYTSERKRYYKGGVREDTI